MGFLRARHLILWAYATYLFADRAFLGGGDWHYFVQASDLLVGHHTRGFDASAAYTCSPATPNCTWGR